MKFYLFISFFVWIFGAFTIVFVLSKSSPNTYLTPLVLLCSVSFLSFSFYKAVDFYTKKLKLSQTQAVTLAKQKQKLKILDQLKTDFITTATEHLHTPLVSIGGYIKMLQKGKYGKLSIKARDAIDKISDSSVIMAETIEEYLTVSRMEDKRMKYTASDFNLKTEASSIVDELRKTAMQRGLILTFKSDMKKGGIVNADIEKVRQILNTLIDNAFQYTTKGTVTIFTHDDVKKMRIYIDIVDNGRGIKKNELENIFNKFERIHTAGGTNETGTGLGLFVSREMARAMQGNLTAYSDGVGHGSTFRLELPLQM